MKFFFSFWYLIAFVITCILQIFTKNVMRFFHTSKQLFAAEKSSLATLRKKTGYTIANCKKALQLHNNDLITAEKWLHEQAQTLGWKKATKLEGRQTTQGLVGVITRGNCAAMVELNCETDFVAKNNEFKSMVETVAESCIHFIDFTSRQCRWNMPVTKICFSGEQIRELPTKDGKKLSDLLALMIGSVGENATFKRAFCFKAGHGVLLAGYAHPSGDELNSVQLGKFGSILAFKQFAPKEVDLNRVGKEICQHIVGLNPLEIGSKEQENPEQKEETSEQKEEESSEQKKEETIEQKEENRLLHQEFLMDEGITVNEYLEESGVEVLDFKRFKCGEATAESGDQPLDLVETCQ
ncbi:elongation factor Ts, mitochondrial [Coccinella septempunctata]|uniref:elongation factor Ts, mitochondrial n=1 Tax=Coccinella septempunctata TaxID=41139 RepID=UPI001D0729B2|nr:elongation factor Ts, mitochondrial [Coccinella septempunctata]